MLLATLQHTGQPPNRGGASPNAHSAEVGKLRFIKIVTHLASQSQIPDRRVRDLSPCASLKFAQQPTSRWLNVRARFLVNSRRHLMRASIQRPCAVWDLAWSPHNLPIGMVQKRKLRHREVKLLA